jgi:hypothetical protein
LAGGDRLLGARDELLDLANRRSGNLPSAQSGHQEDLLASRSSRNFIWPLYGVLVALAFIISITAGIVGAMVGALLWSRFGGTVDDGRRRRSA